MKLDEAITGAVMETMGLETAIDRFSADYDTGTIEIHYRIDGEQWVLHFQRK